MVKKLLFVVSATLLLSGCTIKLPVAPSGLSGSGGSVWKSTDGGDTFVPKVTVNGLDQKMTSADILSLVFNPDNQQVMYMGTLSSGLFKTTDGAETWEKLNFPPTKTYGVAIDRSNTSLVYASGVFGDAGKIYRSGDAGKNWEEIYTEPAAGTFITVLGSHPEVPSTLYAGTSTGVIIKSTDSGQTWKNIFVATAPIKDIVFYPGLPATVTFLVLNKGTVMTSDGGNTWNDYSNGTTMSQAPTQNGQATNVPAVSPSSLLTIVADPSQGGSLYAGAMNGLFHSGDYGKSWQALPIIESSRKFPVRSLAVNPKNSAEIVYTAGKVFYKSTDRGMTWSTVELSIDRGVSIIKYDLSLPSTIYFGLRKF